MKGRERYARLKPDEALRTESNIARFMTMHAIDDFDALLARSQNDVEWFWDAVVRFLGVEWFTPYDSVLNISEGIPWAKWFTGGMVNVAHNCVDRHADRAHDALAILWEGEDASTRRVTYGELRALTSSMIEAFTRRGVTVGDCIGILMPMIPETVAALMAAAAIGAVSVPLFSGFGPDAIAARLRDAGASAVVTVDGFLRRGRSSAEGRSTCPTVPSLRCTVVVVPNGPDVG